MSSKPAPYATSGDKPVYRDRGPASTPTAPWEKDQAPKMQSKGGKASPTNVRSTATAPYGTADNSNTVNRTPRSASNSTTSAPFGTSDNAPFRQPAKAANPPAPPFGTAADGRTFSTAPAPKLASPWERDESKYTHRGKAPSNGEAMAPYATEKK